MAELIKLKNGRRIDEVYNSQNHPLIYKKWAGMKHRCNCPTSSNYKSYGGRGIKVCDEWNDSFASFCKWALENGYELGLTLDRIDYDGNYEPTNCRWVDVQTQANNRRSNTFVTYNGECHSLADWCRILNLNYTSVSNRYYQGARGDLLFAPTRGSNNEEEFKDIRYSDNTLMGWTKKKLISYIRTLEDTEIAEQLKEE